MIAHITKMLELVDKLKAIGEEIRDSHISALLLCSLPPSYDNLVTALEARPEEELTPDFIKNKLTDEYNRRMDSYKAPENPNKAYQATKKHYQAPNNYKRERYCTYCKRKNHNKTECWHLNKQKHTQYNKQNKFKNNNASFYAEKETLHTDFNDVEAGKQLESRVKNLAFLTTKNNNENWIIDSGSSSHICNNINLFDKITSTEQSQVIIANGNVLTSQGMGDITFTTQTPEGLTNQITLTQVLHVPEIESNLLSVKQAATNGCKIIFQRDRCQLLHNDKIYLEGKINNNLYQVELTKSTDKAYVATLKQCDSKNCISLWHRRLGHRNIEAIKTLETQQLAENIKIDNCKHQVDCEICTKGKLTNNPFPKKASNRRTKILELIHSDICGPFPVPTVGGKVYMLTLIDDYSRYTTIYLLSKKDEVLEKVKEYIHFVQNKFGKTPESFRSDNAGEYDSNEFDKYLKELGIHHEFSVAYCSQQNGVAERKNRSLVEMARTMLGEANLNKSLWGEAIHTANYLQNRLPTKATIQTPFELWTGRKPDLSHLRVFGCKAFAYIPKCKRNKLDDRAQEVRFVGYDQGSKGYRVCTRERNVSVVRTVKFFENSNIETNKHMKGEIQPSVIKNQDTHAGKQSDPIEINLDISVDHQTLDTHNDSTDTPRTQPRRSARSNRGVPPNRFSYLSAEFKPDPTNWNDVINIKNPLEKQRWINASDEEIKSLKINNTWTLTDPLPDKKVIGCRWTFKSKLNQNGQIEKYKARLVAKGFSQKFGEDYYETYAPVVSYTTIRTFLAKAAYEKLSVNHLDIKTAFLHGDLTETVYMTQPEGYVVPGQENKVCRLNKAIYGLKQAARAWHTKIAETLLKLKFVQSQNEQCLFKNEEDNETTYLIVYVDDILIAGKQNKIDKIVNELKKQYELTNLGEVSYYLGIQIKKTSDGSYTLNQKLKINELIKKYGLQDAKPCSTPIEAGYQKTDDDDNLLPNNHHYRQAIGSLLYISNICRPDICAAVNLLSRRVEKPREKDWTQVKRVIRYLKTTIDFEFVIHIDSDPKLIVYADADWGGDTQDRKSTSGNLFLLNETPILWTTKKQNSVALSSAEAEYISASAATQDILWILKILKDLDLEQNLPITIYEDNQSTIKMTESAKNTCKSKHIEIKYHHIRDLKENNIIDLQYCPTKHMVADMLTKPLPKADFLRHREKLQLYLHGAQELREE